MLILEVRQAPVPRPFEFVETQGQVEGDAILEVDPGRIIENSNCFRRQSNSCSTQSLNARACGFVGSRWSAQQQAQRETDNGISQDGHGVSYQDLCDIIRARVEEILKLILLEMPNAEYETLVPAGLVLTGGSSNLAGIAALGRDILRLPVRVGSPGNMYGIVDTLLDPAYATSVGLLLWGAKHEGSQNWQSSRLGSALRGLAGRLRRLFG